MDFYNSRYFFINKFLCECIGIWPFDSRKRFFLRILPLAALQIAMVPHWLGLFVSDSDVDDLMEHLSDMFVYTAIFSKLLSVVLAEDKMKMIFNDMVDNWESIDDEEEKIILKKYSERGRTLTIAYAVLMLIIAISFGLSPSIPVVINKMRPLATPLPQLDLLNGEFLVDRNDYYWQIYIFEFSSVAITGFIIVAVDTTLSACVEHCVGLYAIIRYRLQIPTDLSDYDSSTAQDDASYDHLVKIIKLHQKVLRFINMAETAYSRAFFTLMIVSLGSIPLVCVLIIMNANQPINMIRYGMVFVGLSVHLYYLSLAGQKIIDSSSHLALDAYCNEWYKRSYRTNKVLRFLMFRCTQPSMLTAGGLMIMGMETYFKIMKTALSYITVLLSFR